MEEEEEEEEGVDDGVPGGKFTFCKFINLFYFLILIYIEF